MVLQTLNKGSPESLYTVILLDLNMPISDGFDTCQKIRKLYDKEKLIKYTSSENSDISGQIYLRDA